MRAVPQVVLLRTLLESMLNTPSAPERETMLTPIRSGEPSGPQADFLFLGKVFQRKFRFVMDGLRRYVRRFIFLYRVGYRQERLELGVSRNSQTSLSAPAS